MFFGFEKDSAWFQNALSTPVQVYEKQVRSPESDLAGLSKRLK